MGCNCNTCKHCFRDESVGDRECMNDMLTEDEIEMYYAEMKDNCPRYETGNGVVKIGYSF